MKSKKLISCLCSLFAVATVGGVATLNASAEATPNVYEFEMVAGAQDNVKGGAMRFGATMSKADYDALIAKGASFGMVVVPADYVYVDTATLDFADSSVYAKSGYELTEENVWTNNYFSANATGDQKLIIDEVATVETNGDVVTVYGGIENIKVHNYVRSFIGRAYYVVDGVYTFADYNENDIENNTRCMYYVAQQAVAADDTLAEAVQEKYIENFAAYKPNAQYKYFVDTYVNGVLKATEVKGGVLNSTVSVEAAAEYKGCALDNANSVVEGVVAPAGKLRLSVCYTGAVTPEAIVEELTGEAASNLFAVEDNSATDIIETVTDFDMAAYMNGASWSDSLFEVTDATALTKYIPTNVYKFTAAEMDASSEEYLNWNADYVVSFDKAVAANSAGLIGNYDVFGWIAINAPMDIAAGEELRLLASTLGSSVTYEGVLDIGDFYCGAYNLDDANVGTTMTVELRLYEVDEDGNETGNYKLIKAITYTF